MLEFIEKFLERRRMEREGQLGTRKRRKESDFSAAADRSVWLIFALIFVLWGICVLVLTFPEHRNYPTLVASQVAPSTIFARTDFFYEDKAETKRLQQETAKLQPLYFKFSDDDTEVIKQNLDKMQRSAAERISCEKSGKIYSSDQSDRIARQIAALGPVSFRFLAVLNENPKQFEKLKKYTNQLISEGVVSSNLCKQLSGESRLRIFDNYGRHYGERPFRDLITNENAAEKLVQWLLGEVPDCKASEFDKAALNRLMTAVIGEAGNLHWDKAYSSAQYANALKNVKPKMLEIKKNEIIVKRNDEVTQKVVDALAAEKEQVKLLNADYSFAERLIQNALWSLIMLLFAAFYLKHIHPEVTRSSRSIAMIVTIGALSLIINYLAMEIFYFFSGMLAIPPGLVPDVLPLALPAVLLTVMAGYRVALYVGFFAAMISALMLNGSFNVALEGFVLSAVCGLMVRPAGNYRSFFLRAFICTAVTVWLLDFSWVWHVTAAPGELFY